jgi:hypothetical protein
MPLAEQRIAAGQDEDTGDKDLGRIAAVTRQALAEVDRLAIVHGPTRALEFDRAGKDVGSDT